MLLQHLHKEKVIHRDIATRNVLVGEHYGALPPCLLLGLVNDHSQQRYTSQACITRNLGSHCSAVFCADFGLARLTEMDVGTTKTNFGPIKVDALSLFLSFLFVFPSWSFFLGIPAFLCSLLNSSLQWMAPECLVKRQYSEASDAFAYGITRPSGGRGCALFASNVWCRCAALGLPFNKHCIQQNNLTLVVKEMFTRKEPWKGMDPTAIVIAVVQKNTRLKVPSTTDPVVAKIIRSVWKENPDKRCSTSKFAVQFHQPRFRRTMKAIVQLLDDYLETLQAVYDRMSDESDEEAESAGSSDMKVDAYFLPSGSRISMQSSAAMSASHHSSEVYESLQTLPDSKGKQKSQGDSVELQYFQPRSGKQKKRGEKKKGSSMSSFPVLLPDRKEPAQAQSQQQLVYTQPSIGKASGGQNNKKSKGVPTVDTKVEYTYG